MTLFRRSLILVPILLCIGGRARGSEVSLSINPDGKGGYAISSIFWVQGPVSLIWGVLTDYEHLVYIVPSLRTSEVVQRDQNYLLLKQEGIARVLGVFHFSAQVLLKVQTEPKERIVFEDTAHKSFVFYKGEWKLSPASGGGVWVEYALKAKPIAEAPSFITKGAFLRTAQQLLDSVQAEIERRRPPCVVVMTPCTSNEP